MRKPSARSGEDTGPPKRLGPPEPRLKVNADWEEAAAKIIRTPVPKGGVPEKPKRERRGKDDGRP